MINDEMNSGSTHHEGGKEHFSSPETAREGMQLTVRQPEKIHSLLMVLADLEKIAERVSEDRSSDLGGAGSAQAGAQQAGAAAGTQVSLRQQAIQSLPLTPVMQQRLVHHLQREVRQLERQARRKARKMRRGSAHALNQLYARIRKIQTLIADILQAAADVIERLYIRLFIDHQQLV